MRVSLLTCLFAAAITTQGFTAEINQTTVDFQQSITAQCKNGTCSSFLKGSIAVTAGLSLSEIEADGLNDTTTVTLNVDGTIIDIQLGDDPNFQNGDTSANVTAPVTIFNDIQAEVKAQLNWNNGELKIKANVPFAATDIDLLRYVQKPKAGKNNETKDINAIILLVSATNSGGLIFGDDFIVTGDSKEFHTSIDKAAGDSSFKSKESFKSRLLPE